MEDIPLQALKRCAGYAGQMLSESMLTSICGSGTSLRASATSMTLTIFSKSTTICGPFGPFLLPN